MARVRQCNAKLFAAKRVTMTVDSLERLIRVAFNDGYAAGKAECKTGDAMFDALFHGARGK
jgi:hypothetical protein